ncbi:MAG: hypothetical protein GY820_37485 [Gammaproteobacteria bacterium]|nr:hypothetical protein [Gammaproteobacteria bacterium]
MNGDNDESRREFLVDALGLGLFAGFNGFGLMQPGYALSSLPDRLAPGQSVYKIEGVARVNGELADLKTRIGANAVVTTGDNREIDRTCSAL